MGFEIELIPDIQTLPGEYFCPVCRTLVYPNEAIQSQCTHLYCKPCLSYVTSTTQACPYDGYLVTEAHSKPLIESDKALADAIGKVKVHCLYHKSGCTWQGPFSECTSHCSTCPYGNSPVICNRCGIQIVHRQVHDHAQNCPGGNSQPQQTAENVQDTARPGSSVTEQSLSVVQSGAPTSHAQSQQTTVSTTTGQDSTQFTSANSQAQAVSTSAVPTPEQLYQQQYQQYYQQYPGYDPYQQAYQHYYPYQHQAVQQFQQQLPGQAQPLVYSQPQPQPQLQPQPQTQPQSQGQLQSQTQGQGQSQSNVQLQPQPAHSLDQSQLQSHLQPQVRPQNQTQSQPQLQSNLQTQSQPQVQPQVPMQATPQPFPQVSAPVSLHNQNQVPVNPLQQFSGAMRPPTQIQSQGHPTSHGPVPPNPSAYLQAQPQVAQPYLQQPVHVPQYPQSHLQTHHPPLQNQPQPHSHVSQPPPLQPYPQAQAQAQPHPQSQPQSQVQHPQQPYLALNPIQPNQSQIPGGQVQSQHPSGPTVTSHQSYPQPQAQQQLQPGVPQQHSVNMHSGGPLPPAQAHGQFAHPTPQLLHPQSHGLLPNQQGPMTSQSQVSNLPPSQQQQFFSLAQQPSHSVHQRPVMQPVLQPMPQQYLQQQPFPGQPAGLLQNHPHHHGHYGQQQPVHSQIRPQGPLHLMQHNSQSNNQPMQNVALSHEMKSRQPQMHAERSMIPNLGAPSQAYPHSVGPTGYTAQARSMQPVSNQTNQNYAQRATNSAQLSVAPLQQDISEKTPTVREVASPSLNTSGKDANGPGADSAENNALKSEARTSEEPKLPGKDAHDSRKAEESVKNEDLETKDSSGKRVPDETLEEISKETVSKPLSIVTVVEMSAEDKITNDTPVKEVEPSSAEGSLNRDPGSFDREKEMLPKDVLDVNNSGSSNQRQQGGSQAVMVSGDCIERGYQERDLSQSQFSSQVTGADEFYGFQHKDSMRSSQTVAPTDHEKPQLPPPVHHGPINHQQRHTAPSILQHPMPPPHSHVQIPGNMIPLSRPVGPSPHGSFLLDAGFPVPGPASSFGRSQTLPGPPLKSLELQSSATQPMIDSVPPFSIDSRGGTVGRAPPRGLEGHFGSDFPNNPINFDKFLEQRPGHANGRQQSESDLPRLLDRGSFGVPSGIESNRMGLNGVSGVDTSSMLGLREERFRSTVEDRANHFSKEPSLHFDQVSRPMDSAHPTAKYDTGLKLGAASGDASSKYLPHHHLGGFHTNDTREKDGPVGFHDEDKSRVDFAHSHLDFHGPVSGFAPRHHMERLTPRSPDRDYFGSATRGFGNFSGLSRVPLGRDDIDARETRLFGEGSRSFNQPTDPIGSSFHGSRFSLLPGHMQRVELDGPGVDNMSSSAPDYLRNGPNGLASQQWRSEFMGPRNIPSHLRMEEPKGIGSFSANESIREFPGPGNLPPRIPFGESFGVNRSSHARFDEPGFRTGYPFLSNGDGFFPGDLDPYDKSRKRKPASMGWCRICKVDCETVDGLELHTQTREHQKMAMDMVIAIKKKSAKKQKNSSNRFTHEEGVKPRNMKFGGRGNKA